MSWSNVLIIFRREVRDQVRDRRTLFMIFVLPVLLYPILGIGAAKLSEVFREETRTVIVAGAEHLPEFNFRPAAPALLAGVGVVGADFALGPPPLLNPTGDGFNSALFEMPADSARLRVEPQRSDSIWSNPDARRAGLRSGKADAVILIPPDLGARLSELGRVEIPIAYDSADEKSQITFLRVDRVVQRWKELIVENRREAEGKPEGYTEPVKTEAEDVATLAESGATVWAKIFPFLLVMMSLTGAFYPAVDLCAGEKERGTMETLLISPASRSEIVVGKFFTVMVFSISTALLNLASMGLTAWQLSAQFGAHAGALPAAGRSGAIANLLAPPSPASAAWMILLLVPLAGFFSAVCLSLAVMARSMKEGQYYMTPLYLVALPLIFVTLMPGIKLDLFTSLIPITGVSLLLKSLMLGDYGVARMYFLAVMVPIVVYGLIALRWAIDQFRRESVLFRESERFDLAGWLRHLWRDKMPTPGPGQALVGFVLMLVATWAFMPFLGPSLWSMVAFQVGVIFLIPVLMATLLTSDPIRTLRLRWPAWQFLALGITLALALNPLVNELKAWVEYLFPTPEAVKHMLAQLEERLSGLDLGTAILILAVAPAVCEEFAFRGFLLSGLEYGRRTGSAIVLSAFLFGFMHVLLSLFQQLFNATLLGLVLGLLAVRSRSLLPGIVFHFINNAMALVTGMLITDPRFAGLAAALYRDRSQGLYHGYWVALGAIASGVLLIALLQAPRGKPTPVRGEDVPEPLAEAV